MHTWQASGVLSPLDAINPHSDHLPAREYMPVFDQSWTTTARGRDRSIQRVRIHAHKFASILRFGIRTVPGRSENLERFAARLDKIAIVIQELLGDACRHAT